MKEYKKPEFELVLFTYDVVTESDETVPME